MNASDGSRRERRKREVHERIVAAATALFEQRGFAGTTALEIAGAADVAEKTFYNHFPSKQLLIQELAEESLHRLRALLETARAHPGSTAERIHHFFASAALQAADGSRALTRELILELVRVSQVEGLGPERNRDLHACFARMLRDGLARGDVAQDLDVDFHAEMAVAAYTGMIINWVSLPDYPLRERLEASARFLAEAVSAPLPSVRRHHSPTPQEPPSR